MKRRNDDPVDGPFSALDHVVQAAECQQLAEAAMARGDLRRALFWSNKYEQKLIDAENAKFQWARVKQ